MSLTAHHMQLLDIIVVEALLRMDFTNENGDAPGQEQRPRVSQASEVDTSASPAIHGDLGRHGRARGARMSAAELTAEERTRIIADQKRANAWAIEQSAKEWRESPAGQRFLSQPVELKARTAEDWTALLRRQGKMRLTDEENVRLCLKHDPALAEVVVYDEFAEELLAVKPMPGPVLEPPNGFAAAMDGSRHNAAADVLAAHGAAPGGARPH